MKTDTLLLNRNLGFAVPEDYVTWAVERLSAGDDSFSLSILAGLNLRFDCDEVERYFLQSCKELGIDVPTKPETPRDTAVFVWQGYKEGEVSAEMALNMMAKLYSKSGYSDPLLAIWLYIQEDMSLRGSGYDGCFYPPELLNDLNKLFEQEWDLYRRSRALSLPRGFLNFNECTECGYIGKPVRKYRSIFSWFKSKLAGQKPALWFSCSRCGAFDYRGMTDPTVRDRYFRQIEAEQAGSVGREPAAQP